MPAFGHPQLLLLGRVPPGSIEHEQDASPVACPHFPGAKFSEANENASALTAGRTSQWTSPLFGRTKA
jgi:hypothetical protein